MMAAPVSLHDYRFVHGDPVACPHIDGRDVVTVGWSAAEYEVYAHLAEVDDYVRRHPNPTTAAAQTPVRSTT